MFLIILYILSLIPIHLIVHRNLVFKPPKIKMFDRKMEQSSLFKIYQSNTLFDTFYDIY